MNIFRRFLCLIIVVLILLLSGMCIYRYCGLKQYFKAVKYINEIPLAEKREMAWKGFLGVSGDGHYSGIYAGKFLGMVWVWGRMGLRPFVAQKQSTYSFFDGCSDVFLANEHSSPPTLNRELYFEEEKWRQKVKVGDAVSILLPNKTSFWSLKEAYVYNFWPFIQKDQKTECAK